ncbi:SH3 domain-containing protein [Yoonia sp. SS1-5]|uniref:SH3 domain-containing protein n=1 Tax=Yoonia rhodophyticola TaxID=3137370 RepID=A0AAN0M8V9_9RHOB
MRRNTFPTLLAFLLIAGCSTLGTDRTVVTGTGPDELLKLRSGPGLGFGIIMGLPDGTVLNRRTCVTEVGQLWCQVSLADAPQVTGYVSADYLAEQ